MKTIIEQEVDCAFGKNHKVIVELEGQMLRNISCSCYSNRKEVMGFIKLGELQNATCFQAMEWLKDKFTNKQSYMFGYNSSPYSNTPLNSMSDNVRRAVNSERQARFTQKEHLKEIKRRAQEGIVTKRLNEIRERVLGNTARECYEINKEPSGYVFYLKTGKTRTKIANRIEGIWHVPHAVEGIIRNHPVKRNCPFCDVCGTYSHSVTKSHKNTIIKKTFIALQATSGPGIRMYHNEERNTLKDEFEPSKLFRYRKSATEHLGICRDPEIVIPVGDSNA